MSSSINKILIVSVCLFSATFSLAKSFRAYVDPNPVAVGESLTLFLEFSGSPQQEPDLTSLAQDFSILSRSQSTNSFINNGRMQSKTTFSYTIRPKMHQEGSIIIRPITLNGESSAPITINVMGRRDPTPGIEVKATVAKHSVYINEPIYITVSLVARVNIGQISLKPPTIANGIIEPIGDGVALETIENGVKVVSYEQRFLAFVDTPGEESIGPATFEGVVSKSGRSFTGFPFREAFHEPTEAIKISVKPAPAAFPKDHPFIAVENLAVVETLLSKGPYETNKAITRKFEVRGKNTLATFLPVPALPKVDGLKIYSEPGNKIQRAEDGNLIALLETAHVYMPTQKGSLKIPEQVIYWWNTATDQLMSTPIRAVELAIEGGTEAAPSAPAVNTTEVITPNTSKESPKVFNVWSLLAGIFFALWIATVLFFWWVYQRTRLKPAAKERSFSNASQHLLPLKEALSENSTQRVFKALTDLKRYAHAESLSGVSDAFADETSPLGKAYRLLNEAIYGAHPKPVDFKDLHQLPAQIKQLLAGKDLQRSELPHVYPKFGDK